MPVLPVRQIYELFDLFYDVLSFTVLIPICLGMVKWRLLGKSERWIIAFLLALLLHELLSQLFWRLHIRNHFLYYVQTVTVLISVAGVYSSLLGTRRILWAVAAVVILLMVFEVSFRVGFNYINSATLTISRLLPALYGFICLNRLLSEKEDRSLIPNSIVYMHAGFFLFGAFTAINVCFKSYFIENSLDFYYLFNTISAMICTVSFSLFSLGFLRTRSATID